MPGRDIRRKAHRVRQRPRSVHSEDPSFAALHIFRQRASRAIGMCWSIVVLTLGVSGHCPFIHCYASSRPSGTHVAISRQSILPAAECVPFADGRHGRELAVCQRGVRGRSRPITAAVSRCASDRPGLRLFNPARPPGPSCRRSANRVLGSTCTDMPLVLNVFWVTRQLRHGAHNLAHEVAGGRAQATTRNGGTVLVSVQDSRASIDVHS